MFFLSDKEHIKLLLKYLVGSRAIILYKTLRDGVGADTYFSH